MASFGKLTRANMLKYMQEEMDEPQHKGSLKDTDEEGEDVPGGNPSKKTLERVKKRDKQYEEDKKSFPKRGASANDE